MKFSVFFLLSFLTLMSCGNLNNSKLTNTTTLETLSGDFKITILNKNELLSKDLSIAFDTIAKRLSGFSGCNRYFGTFETENNTLEFSPLASTKMFCKGEANQIETEMLQTLSKIDSFSLENNLLKLYSNKNILIEAVQNKNIIASIEYYASSRNFHKSININKKTIAIASKREGKPVTKTYSSNDWNKISKTVKSN